MCSLVRARIARCASLSLARFRASCAGVRVETLRVPNGKQGLGQWELLVRGEGELTLALGYLGLIC